MTGTEWCDKPQTWRDMLRPDVSCIEFDIISGSEKPFAYKIITDCSWLEFSKSEGVVTKRDRISLKVNKALLDEKITGSFEVEGIGIGKAHVTVEVAPDNAPSGVFIESDGYICMEAAHYQDSCEVPKGQFKILSPYGRSGSAVKVFPVTADFYKEKKRPFVEYRFLAKESAEYDITFDLAPTTPVTFMGGQYIGYSINGSKIKIINTVKKPDEQFFFSAQWTEEARNNVKKVVDSLECVRGENVIRFYGMSPGIVLERILLVRKGILIPESYLGPEESYIRPEVQISGEDEEE